MTGEVTLAGRVLPIGGVKQKLLAAHRAGLTEVIIPARNEPDLDDLPEEVRAGLTIHALSDVADVLALALRPVPGTGDRGLREISRSLPVVRRPSRSSWARRASASGYRSCTRTSSPSAIQPNRSFERRVSSLGAMMWCTSVGRVRNTDPAAFNRCGSNGGTGPLAAP